MKLDPVVRKKRHRASKEPKEKRMGNGNSRRTAKGIESRVHSWHASFVSHLARARNVFDIEIAGLKAVRAQLDAAFEKAVDVIVRAVRQRGKIVVTGIGKSGNVGRKIAATLTSTGAHDQDRKSTRLNSSHSQ